MTIDRKIKIKIARYYYIENYTQTKIAEMLSIPRQTVNRVVQNLISEGIVRFEIIGDEEYYTGIETELEKKYGLKQAIIIDYNDPKEIETRLGQKGAEYLQNVVKPSMRLGLSWGNTLGALAEWLPKKEIKDINVVQLVGGTNYMQSSMKADEITRIIAQKLNGRSYLLYAPSHVKNQETKRILLNESNIQGIFREIEKCDIAFIGIGSMQKNATLFQENYLSKQEYEELIAEGCVGDICSHYFDREGKIVEHPVNDIVIGIDIENLRRIPLVVGIAGGMDKQEAITGALKGGYLDVLITTRDIAETLLHR